VPLAQAFFMLHLHRFTFNPFQENTYVVRHSDGTCIIVDPGCHTASEQQHLNKFLQDNQLKPLAIVNTHAHIDHILGLDYLRSFHKIPFYLHPLELEVLEWAPQSGKMWGFDITEQEAPEHLLSSTGTLCVGNIQLEIRFCPGHSPGSVCFINPEDAWLIGGDVLFREGIGRTDLPGGNHHQLLQSIKAQLFTLPEHFNVFPGHGPETSIGHERLFNPFLNEG
jgi:glyoxylase-like metal-dependent hydrolase (beta-lactamase superfamily II)